MLLGNTFSTVGKPVCFPYSGARKWQKMHLWVAHMKNKKPPKSQIFTFQIYCQEQLLQQRNNWSNTNFRTFCAKFIIILTYNHIFLIFLYKYNWIQQKFKHVIVSWFFLKPPKPLWLRAWARDLCGCPAVFGTRTGSSGPHVPVWFTRIWN